MTATATRRADRWLLDPAPASRLAAFRILVGAFAAFYLVARLPRFLDLADGRPSPFDPVGALWFLDDPLRPLVLNGMIVAAIAGAIALTVGIGHRVTGPALSIVLLVLTTYRSSWGQLLHFENLMVLHVVVVGFSPAADVWSFDARRRRAGTLAPSERYGWPLRLAALMTVTTYVIAGVAKLRYGGLGWLDGDTLRNHIAYTAARLDVFGESTSPIAGPLVGRAWIFTPMAVAGVAIELAAPVALLGRRWRNGWVTAAVTMHACIAATMYIVFPYPLFAVAFAPLFDLERGVDWISRWRVPFRLSPRPSGAG
jgi:hypothetical protein